VLTRNPPNMKNTFNTSEIHLTSFADVLKVITNKSGSWRSNGLHIFSNLD